MIREKDRIEDPFFSICIPQHNRTSFLIEVCRSLEVQTYRNFEVCISDDCSTDGREQELLNYLENSNLAYVYQRQSQNLRYDGNIRASMALARGKWLFLLGNDDAIATSTTLAEVAHHLETWGEQVGVVFTNYEDYATGVPYPRVATTGILGSGPGIAVHQFRNFSFVSGVIVAGEKAREFATERWDGSEMYQTYIGCRIIASGKAAATLNQVTIRKDIQIVGEGVDSYITVTHSNPDLKKARTLPFTLLGRLVADAIQPYTSPANVASLSEKIFVYIYIFPYAYWLVEYRRIQSWLFAFNIAIGMRPTSITSDIALSWWQRLRLYGLYSIVTVTGLLLPVTIFQRTKQALHRFAKKVHL